MAGSARRRFTTPEVFFKYRLLREILTRRRSLRLPRPAGTATPRSCLLLREPGDRATSEVSSILQYATTEILNPIFN